MTTSKAAEAEAGKTATILQPSQECCMCGDFGLPSEIFRCEDCQFRSQHRYCSNQYPKAEAYRLCNWCLNRKDESGDKTQNSLNSASSNRTNTSDQDDVKTTKKKNGSHGSLRKSTSVKLRDIKSSIKKQRSPERLPLLAARKRIMTTTMTTDTTATATASDAMEDKLRRTKSSSEISNGGNGMIRKPFFRNKVRRYKLLDEVSSL